MITCLQKIFYLIRHRELSQEIKELGAFPNSSGTVRKMKELTERSMEYLRAEFFDRYRGKRMRVCFSDDAPWRFPARVLEEYPIVLSTIFSSRSSLKGAVYDSIIMDEASQVDRALALSYAENAVVVGDLKQLPNIIPDSVKKQSEWEPGERYVVGLKGKRHRNRYRPQILGAGEGRCHSDHGRR